MITMVANALRKCSIAVAGNVVLTSNGSWDDMKRWITNAGGRLTRIIESDTTHLVVDEKLWKAQADIVGKALATKYAQLPIKIVSADWLSQSLFQQTKKKEGAYLWEKLDKASLPSKKKAKQAQKEIKERRPPGGILGAALKQHTDETLGKIRTAKQSNDEKDREAEEKRSERERKRKLSREDAKAIFQLGTKKARNEIFSGESRSLLSSELRSID